jgi:predicted chitinase
MFLKLAGNTTRNSFLYNYFVESMNRASIANQYRAAAYFATLVGESNFFKDLESKITDPDINIDLGNDATGDGSNFRGRGAILVRGKQNYMLANSRLGLDLINKPERAAFPSVAFKLAAWFWNENAYIIKTNSTASKGNLNELVDGTFFNFTMIVHALTNDVAKLKERANFNDLVLAELKYPSMKRGQGI